MVTKDMMTGAEQLATRLMDRFRQPEGLEFQDKVKSVLYYHFSDILVDELQKMHIDWELGVDKEAGGR